MYLANSYDRNFYPNQRWRHRPLFIDFVLDSSDGGTNAATRRMKSLIAQPPTDLQLCASSLHSALSIQFGPFMNNENKIERIHPTIDLD
jgi:hypothetical protein